MKPRPSKAPAPGDWQIVLPQGPENDRALIRIAKTYYQVKPVEPQAGTGCVACCQFIKLQDGHAVEMHTVALLVGDREDCTCQDFVYRQQAIADRTPQQTYQNGRCKHLQAAFDLNLLVPAPDAVDAYRAALEQIVALWHEGPDQFPAAVRVACEALGRPVPDDCRPAREFADKEEAEYAAWQRGERPDLDDPIDGSESELERLRRLV